MNTKNRTLAKSLLVADDSNLVDGKFNIHLNFQKSVSEADPQFLGIIEGYASTPDIDREKDQITEKALQSASSDLLSNSSVFFNHRHQEMPIGKVLDSTYIRGKGLYVKVGISKTAPEIWTGIQEGILNKFSIFGRFGQDYQIVTKEIDGKDSQIRQVNSVDLYEVSIVGIPANMNAGFSLSEAVVKFLDIQKVEKTMEDKIKKTVDKTEVEVVKTDTFSKDQLEKALADQKETILKTFDSKFDELTKQITKVETVEKKLIPDTPKIIIPEGETVRKTGIRSNPDDNVTFKSAQHYENWERTEFAKALILKDDVFIDMMGTPVRKEALVNRV